MKRSFLIGCSLLAVIVVSFGCGSDSTTPTATVATSKTLDPDAPRITNGVLEDGKGHPYCIVMKHAVISKEKAVGMSEYHGVKYYFCCGSCKPLFDQDPTKYAVQ